MGTNGASTPEAPGTIREPDLLFEVQEIALETRKGITGDGSGYDDM